MVIYFTLTTDTAVYQFQVNKEANQVRVTKLVLKGQEWGQWHCSTSLSLDAGRKLVRQLQRTK